jgi:hypothetical protein
MRVVRLLSPGVSFLSLRLGKRLTVHLTAIANPHNEDTQSAILNAADDSVIAYAVFPELAQLGTLEGFPNAAWVVKRSNALM